jgi:tRNA wybutosine-synthesizing protein 1
MSCSGEVVDVENEFIQIKPVILDQLRKAKYGVSDHGTAQILWNFNS